VDYVSLCSDPCTWAVQFQRNHPKWWKIQHGACPPFSCWLAVRLFVYFSLSWLSLFPLSPPALSFIQSRWFPLALFRFLSLSLSLCRSLVSTGSCTYAHAPSLLHSQTCACSHLRCISLSFSISLVIPNALAIDLTLTLLLSISLSCSRTSLHSRKHPQANPKTPLDWQIKLAKTLPGPGQYYTQSDANAGVSGGKFNPSNSKSDLDWTIYRAERVSQRECQARAWSMCACICVVDEPT